jgi:hypothetical protein
MSADMHVAEAIRMVLHKRNYEERLQWNEVEICDLAMSLVMELPKYPSMERVSIAIDNITHSRRNWQRQQLPEESAKWWEKLT